MFGFGKATAERIAKAVRQVEGTAKPDANSAPASPSGRVAGVYTARITSGTADGNGNYPAVITMYDSTVPGWVDFGAVKVKARGGESLVSGARCSVRTGGTIGTDALFLTADNGAATGTFTVQDSGAITVYASVTTLEIDLASGLTLTQPAGAGTARIGERLADLTHPGTVSIVSQSFAGLKTFNDAILLPIGTATGTTLATFGAGVGSLIGYSAVNYLSYMGAGSSGVTFDAIHSGDHARAGIFYSVNAGQFVWDIAQIGSTAMAYSAQGNTGATGTSGGGDTVTGGIITQLGAGGADPIQNSVFGG